MDENYNQRLEEEFLNQPSKRKIISLIIGGLIAIFLVIAIVALISSRFSNGSSGKVTLTYWGAWEDSNVFNEIIQDFNKSNPNIEVKYEKQDIKNLGKYIDRLATRTQNDTGPDIFRFHNSWIKEVKPLLLTLPQDAVETSEIDSQYFETVKRDLRIDGGYYGIPLHIDTLALFVNKEIFEQAGITDYPTTWDDLISVARQLTVKDSEDKIITSGVALGTADNIAHATDIISLLLVQNGADLEDLNGSTKTNTIDALDYYTSFSNGDSKVWDESLDNSKLAFAKGNLAMYFGYSWDIFEIKALNPNLNFEVVSVPHLPGRNMTIASYWVEGVSAKSKHSKEAFEFLKYLSQRSTLEKLYSKQSQIRLFGELYPRTDMVELLKDNALVYPFVEQASSVRATFFSSDTYDDAMVDSLNSYLLNAIRSINNDGTSPQSAVETLAQGVEQVLSRYEE